MDISTTKPIMNISSMSSQKATLAALLLAATAALIPMGTMGVQAQGIETPPPNIKLTEGNETIDLNPTSTPTPTPSGSTTTTNTAPQRVNPTLPPILPQDTTSNSKRILPPPGVIGIQTKDTAPLLPVLENPPDSPQDSTLPKPLANPLAKPTNSAKPDTQTLMPLNPEKYGQGNTETTEQKAARIKTMQERIQAIKAQKDAEITPAPIANPENSTNSTDNPTPSTTPTTTTPTPAQAPKLPKPNASPEASLKAQTPAPTPEPTPEPEPEPMENPMGETPQTVTPKLAPKLGPASTPIPLPMPKILPKAPVLEPIPKPMAQGIEEPTPTQKPKLTPPNHVDTLPETTDIDPGLAPDMGAAVGGDLLPAITDKAPQDVEEILKELEERTKAAPTRQTVTKPNVPKDEHVYENVPLLRVLRILAEESGINFIEPNMTEEEAGNISLRLQKMTPLEAFLRVAESRGFRVVTRNDYTTLTRPDISSPRFLITRKYPLRFTDPMWALQSVANLLNIDIKTPSNSLITFPTPEDTSQDNGGGGGGGGSSSGGGASGLDLSNVGVPDSPRWISSLPYDAPLSKGTAAQGSTEIPSLFLDRKSNSIVVKASEEEQFMVQKYIQEMDVPEPQIMIEARIVEMSLDDELVQGVDWKKPFGPGDANGLKVGLIPTVGTDPNINIATFTQSAIRFLFTPTTLFLDSSTANIIIRNFQTLNMGSVVSEPRVMTKTGVPVNISSTVVENIPVLTPQSNTGGTDNINSTSFQSFTTGLAMDVVARLLDNGEVELNINPTVASEIGRTAPTPEIPSGVPILSQRVLTTTATVRTGMTVVIGGLNQYNSIKTTGGVPPLNRLPFLGTRVFGDRNHDKAKRTLLVFVTPRIIYPNETERVYTNQAEYNLMLEATRQNPVYQTEPKPNGIEIRKATPVQRKLRP